MGKEKGQRIKGNMAPAASSKAAELLRTNQQQSFGFGSSSSIASASGFGAFVEEYSSLDPLLQVPLKKLSKRDSITKAKALDEILGILKGDLSLVDSLISVWDPIFNKMVIDVDRKVRESVMLVHLDITRASSKKLAPILKKIIGAWIIARFDVSKEVSNLAKESFLCSFSQKNEQVLVHCQAELLDYLKNNILDQTVESMSDSRYTSAEDMAAKYARTVASSFDAFSYVLETISTENRKMRSVDYDTLIVDKRLWAHIGHKSPVIRSAVYRMIKICVLNAPELVSLSIDYLAKSFLSNCFGEKDSECYLYLWDAVLLLTKHHPEVWSIASEKKNVIKKIFACLAEGIYGSGKTSYPSILPLIAHLPEFIRDEYFFNNFFINFWKGSDKLDRFSGSTFMDSYYECCQYLVKRCDITCSSPNVDLLISVDFLRPIESLLCGKLSKIPKDVVVKSFLKYTTHTFSTLGNLMVSSFENALFGLLERSLLSDQYYPGSIEFLAIELLEADCVSNDIFVRLIPILLARSNEKKNDSMNLLLLILEIGLPYSHECQVSLYQFAINELKNKSLNFPLLVKISIRIIFALDDTRLAESKTLWSNLLQCLTKEYDFEANFQTIVGMIENGPLDFISQVDDIDNYLKQNLSIHNSKQHILFESLLSLNRSALIIEESTLDSSFKLFKETIDQISVALYTIPTKPLDTILYRNSYSLLKAVQSILETKSNVPERTLNFILENFFLILQLSVCDPTIIGLFTWESSTDMNANDSIRQLRSTAESIVSHIQHENIEINPDFGSLLGKEWSDRFSNINHCGSPLDFIEELKILFKLSTSVEYQSSLWKEILQTSAFWEEMSNPYFSRHSSSMCLADPMLFWTFISPSPLLKKQDILYDHDGLSCYSRYAVLLLGILKDKEFNLPYDQYWLIHELLRFRFVCNDSVFEEDPFPFSDDFLIHAKRIESDVEGLLSRLFISEKSDFDLIIEAIQNDSSSSGLSNPSALLFSFSKAFFLDREQFVRISDSRIFGYLFEKTEKSSSLYSRVILELFQRKQNFLVSSLLLNLNTSFQALDFGDVFKVLVRSVTSTAPLKKEHSDQFNTLIMLCHFLHSFRESSAALITNQERTSLLRWIRSFYDIKISESPSKIDESPFSVMFDSIMSFLLNLILQDMNTQSADIGLSMSNFFTNLSVYWLNGLANSTITEEKACLLYYNCKIWMCLQLAADEDPESWQRVVDVEEDVEDLLLGTFIIVSQQNMLSTSGFAVLQNTLAEIIAEFSHADLIEILISREIMIYEMYFTKNEVVQKTSYILAKAIAAKRVQDLSVSIEMQTTDSQPVYLKEALVKGLQYQVKNETDQFGYLLSWLSLLDHFLDATFDLRQYYTSHLRELNVLGTFLETIFGIFNVNTAEKEPFNLDKWDFEEYMIEGFDISSENSIPLLCAHLYYRLLKSVPSLVRLWFSECKSRQFVLAVENYTEKFFSPLLVSFEIKSVQKLIDNDMSIKVNPKTYDIAASYTFEEAELDIIIKMPSCFPLKLAEVSSGSGGGRMAGISDARWRGWLLAVSSVMMGHNGSVADSLAQFKKNVSMHFEGIEDCAICYSVISLADRSTPQKACRVCKHVFHGSCLYKWFKSSNQNQCPLCRQPI